MAKKLLGMIGKELGKFGKEGYRQAKGALLGFDKKGGYKIKTKGGTITIKFEK